MSWLQVLIKMKFKFNYIWGIEMFNLGLMNLLMPITLYQVFNCYSAGSKFQKLELMPLGDNMYGGIESVNTLIQNILYYDKNNVNYNTRLGEGYFLRAFFYLLG